MLKRLEYLALLALAGAIACLVVANIALILANRSAQAEIQANAQFIQQTAQLEVLYREIVKALADLSVKNQDANLQSLLAAHGITVTVNAPAATAEATASPAPRKGAAK
jgi:hypothetical protein